MFKISENIVNKLWIQLENIIRRKKSKQIKKKNTNSFINQLCAPDFGTDVGIIINSAY